MKTSINTADDDNVTDATTMTILVQAAFNEAFEEAKSGGLAAKQAIMVFLKIK